ncbi:MAG: hypothetical protein ACP6IS_04205 [Candidatus Asgardarchaeia archaeon]
MFLDWLLSIPWLEISWGFFISGILLTIIAVIGATEGGGADVHHDIDMSHDLDLSHDLDISHDIDVSHDLDVSHDIDMDHDIDHSGFSAHGSTPLTLLLGAFLLVYGGFGIAIFGYYGVTLSNVLGILGITIFIVFLVSFSWKKIFTTGTYTWRPEFAVGRIATVQLPVDYKGGSIKIDTHTPLGFVVYPAKSLDPQKQYPAGELVQVVGFKEGYAIVSDSPLTRKKNENQ